MDNEWILSRMEELKNAVDGAFVGKEICEDDLYGLQQVLQEKIDSLRQMQEPCDYCKTGTTRYFYDSDSGISIDMPVVYCPNCGRDLSREKKEGYSNA